MSLASEASACNVKTTLMRLASEASVCNFKTTLMRLASEASVVKEKKLPQATRERSERM
jgi:hypothetical protein